MELQGVFSVFFTENLIPLSMTLCGYRGPCAQTYSREPVLSLTHTWAGLGSGCEEGNIFKHSCMFFCEYVSFLLVKNLGVGVLDHRVSVLFNLMRSQQSHEGSAISAASRVWERRRATAFPASAAVPSVLGILPGVRGASCWPWSALLGRLTMLSIFSCASLATYICFLIKCSFKSFVHFYCIFLCFCDRFLEFFINSG